jgi:shikimate kinase
LRGESGLAIATGGGIVMRERNRALLRELGAVVWLTAGEDVIFERVSRNKKRPLLQTENPRETIRKLLAERLPFYKGAAQITIETGSGPHAHVAEAVIVAARQFFSNRKQGEPR